MLRVIGGFCIKAECPLSDLYRPPNPPPRPTNIFERVTWLFEKLLKILGPSSIVKFRSILEKSHPKQLADPLNRKILHKLHARSFCGNLSQ